MIRKKVRKKFGVSSENILALIYSDRYISDSAMAEVINISERAVEKQIAKLEEKGILKRIWRNKEGYWKINF